MTKPCGPRSSQEPSLPVDVVDPRAASMEAEARLSTVMEELRVLISSDVDVRCRATCLDSSDYDQIHGEYDADWTTLAPVDPAEAEPTEHAASTSAPQLAPLVASRSLCIEVMHEREGWCRLLEVETSDTIDIAMDTLRKVCGISHVHLSTFMQSLKLVIGPQDPSGCACHGGDDRTSCSRIPFVSSLNADAPAFAPAVVCPAPLA